MRGSINRYCFCRDPETGKEVGPSCPRLRQTRHGQWEYRDRLTTATGPRPFRRRGFPTKNAAETFQRDVYRLLDLARGDTATSRRIADLIFSKTKRGGHLPAADDVKRRLGLGRDLHRSETFGEAWPAWLAGKKKLRPSARHSYDKIGRNWLLPVLADIALDRLTGEHCSMVFERIDLFNEAIEAAQDAGRRPVLPGDVGSRARYTGVATQHRIYAALRAFLNHQWKKTHRIPFNPIYAVELEPEQREPQLVWEPGQVAHFLAFTADDRLHFLWRLALLRGLRRRELAGLGADDIDLGAGAISVNVALLQVGGKLVWGRPKSRAGVRVVDLDAGTIAVGRAHQARRKRERLAAGGAWQESDRAFTTKDGRPLAPDYISRRFKELAAAARLPVIKLHAARHTAASLMLEAGLDVKIVQEVLGHSTSAITRDTYQHVRRKVHKDAAEKVVALLPAPAA
jgi:integrase